MSTDTNALLDLGADFAGTVWLATALAHGVPALAPVVEQWRAKWKPHVWSVERPDVITGPGGFAIRIEARVASIYHMMPWSHFCAIAAEREPLRDALRAIGALLGSTRVLYVHELLPHEGTTLDEREQSLRAQFGAPSQTFDDLGAADLWSPGCWMREDYGAGM